MDIGLRDGEIERITSEDIFTSPLVGEVVRTQSRRRSGRAGEGYIASDRFSLSDA